MTTNQDSDTIVIVASDTSRGASSYIREFTNIIGRMQGKSIVFFSHEEYEKIKPKVEADFFLLDELYSDFKMKEPLPKVKATKPYWHKGRW